MAVNFDLHDLIAFRAAAELASFRKAAEAVHISQPAFSRRIDKLEQALGVRLLERTTRRVTLTAVGREFARKVGVLLDDLDETLLAVRGVGTARMGEVSVACVPSTVYYFLSEVIHRYRERYPKLRVKVFDASANEVLSAVAGGEADWLKRVQEAAASRYDEGYTKGVHDADAARAAMSEHLAAGATPLIDHLVKQGVAQQVRR